MKEIPNIARGGKLIERADPQPEVRKNAETAKDWIFAEEAANLYRMAVLFRDRFLDPVLLTDRRRLPDPVISFANLRNKNTLGTYTLFRNSQGLLYEITFNKEHYLVDQQDGKHVLEWRFGKWAQLETLLHEQVHLWQQNFGADPVRPGRIYHNKEFVDKCASLGLHPLPGAGCHIRLGDGVFATLMKELGVEPPAFSEEPDNLDIDWFKWYQDSLGKSRKGTSTLNKWTCPECGLKIRVGIKGNPDIRHDPCEENSGHPVFFVQGDGVSHIIFKNEK